MGEKMKQRTLLWLWPCILFVVVVVVSVWQMFDYDYAFTEGDPPYLVALESLAGKVKEVPGPKNNEWIQDAYRICNVPQTLWQDDTTSWCSAGLNKVFHDCGLKGSGNATSISWVDYGAPVFRVTRGMVCVFDLGTNFHVTVLTSEEKIQRNGKTYYACIGCNQSNQIKVSYYEKTKLIAMRWPTIHEIKEK